MILPKVSIIDLLKGEIYIIFLNVIYMFRLTGTKENVVAATYQYLKAIGAMVTEETVEDTLKKHPDYPSLSAVSDSLTEWYIENVSLQVKPEHITELPTPFLAHLQIESGLLALVKSVKGNVIEWIHTKEGLKKEVLGDFLKKWDGVVLLAETNEQSGEKNYRENHLKEIISNLRTPILIFGSIVLLFNLLYQSFATDWHFNVLLITKLAGTIVSSLLLWQSIDQNNPFIRNLCQVTRNVNCDAILSSEAAKVTSWLTWSEVGFFYFGGGFVTLLIDPASMFLLMTIGTLTILYTCWSLYYQAFMARQWCTLCLIIQFIITIEFFTSLVTISEIGRELFSITTGDFVSVFLGSGIVILLWVFVKPFFTKSQLLLPLKNDLRRFKNDPGLFLSMLEKQSEKPLVPNNMDTIMMGNLNAEHTLTMVTNPFCPPCAKAYKLIDNLLVRNKNLKCQVIFLVSDSENDRRRLFVHVLFSLPRENRAEALRLWYKMDKRSVENWKIQLGDTTLKNIDETIDKHRLWCNEANIDSTPSLFFNNHMIPELYRLDDLNIIDYVAKTDKRTEFQPDSF